MFTIDWVVSLGDVAQVASVITGVMFIFFKMRGDIQLLSYDISNIKDQQKALNESFSQLGKVLTQVSVQDARMMMLEKSIDELRHGRGFVKKD